MWMSLLSTTEMHFYLRFPYSQYHSGYSLNTAIVLVVGKQNGVNYIGFQWLRFLI